MINEKQARKFCKEDISKIKNYDKALADTTQVWHCHHMTETWWNCSRKELIENECYYNRKACELVFLTKAEHTRMHMQGKRFSEEHRKKLSEVKKGHSDFWKGKHHSEETLRKMSKAHKGHAVTEETRKKLSEATKRRWKMHKQKINGETVNGSTV